MLKKKRVRNRDHKIEMKTGFEPKSFKTYNLTPEAPWMTIQEFLNPAFT